jgi:hypothetical protein
MTGRRRFAVHLPSLLTLVVIAAQAAPAYAQADVLSAEQLARLKEKATSELWVFQETAPDQPIHGFLTHLTDHDLTLLVGNREQTIPLHAVRRIDRRGDTVWDGFAIGAAVGVVSWVRFYRGGVPPEAAVYVVGIPGLIGAGIDALWVGETTVYRAPDRVSARASNDEARRPHGRRASLGWTVRF